MAQATVTLLKRQSELARAQKQLVVLSDSRSIADFDQQLGQTHPGGLRAREPEILQVNLGKLCNMTCVHCHVDAGPDRREIMSLETAEECLAALRLGGMKTLDLTGGAPEMNPHFRHMVQSAHEMGVHVIDRCNLTILLAKGYEDLPEFLAANGVEVVASLPCYLEDNTDAQRGDGTYAKSIEALQKLNALGYGRPDSGLALTLVYNPVGFGLPPDQSQLEDDYRKYLREKVGVEFTRLFTITNMPISRYLDYLLEEGKFEEYMRKLVAAYNPAAIEGLMCRNTLSVGWDGNLYDCDFNQMLELPVREKSTSHIRNFSKAKIENREIATHQHCFGCTAGFGSGCQGAIE